MFKACIFDLDGTLCDSVESIAHCGNRVMRELGMKEAPLENYKYFVGDGVDMLLRRLLQYCGDSECAQFDRTKRLYTEYFKEGCLYHIRPYPGILEMAERLRALGARLGVLSNKPHANTGSVIANLFEAGCFDWVQGQSAELPRKPEPDGAFFVADKLGVKPQECLYVGDTGTDMRTGRAAGMYTVGVLWGFRDRKELEREGADRIIADPLELLEIYQGK